MKILELPINSIKPDKTQPRQTFRQEELDDLAKNITSQGLINPIEIDEHKIIITGERRWRASKLAGLKTIRCFENNLTGKERFLHQLSENLHHNSMTDLDTARALDKVLKDYGLVSPGDSKKGSGGYNDKGITWLSKVAGKSRGYISEKLALLREPEDMKEAIDKGDIPSTMVRTMRHIPKPLMPVFRGKILHKEFETRDVAELVSQRLRDVPDKAEEILEADYSGKNYGQVRDILRLIAPDEGDLATDALKHEFDDGDEIVKGCLHLSDILSARSPREVSKTNQGLVLMSLAQLRKNIDRWLTGEETQKIIQLTGEVIESQ